jgi:hypothetical protein
MVQIKKNSKSKVDYVYECLAMSAKFLTFGLSWYVEMNFQSFFLNHPIYDLTIAYEIENSLGLMR